MKSSFSPSKAFRRGHSSRCLINRRLQHQSSVTYFWWYHVIHFSFHTSACFSVKICFSNLHNIEICTEGGDWHGGDEEHWKLCPSYWWHTYFPLTGSPWLGRCMKTRSRSQISYTFTYNFIQDSSTETGLRQEAQMSWAHFQCANSDGCL